MGLLEQASNIAYALRNNKLDVTNTLDVIDLYEILLDCIGYLQAIAEHEDIAFIKDKEYSVVLPEFYQKEYMLKK